MYLIKRTVPKFYSLYTISTVYINIIKIGWLQFTFGLYFFLFYLSKNTRSATKVRFELIEKALKGMFL